MVFILGKGHMLIWFLFVKLFSQHKRRNILRVLQRRKLLLFDICIREKVSTFWQDFQVGSLANITTSSSSYKTIHIDGGNFRKRKNGTRKRSSKRVVLCQIKSKVYNSTTVFSTLISLQGLIIKTFGRQHVELLYNLWKEYLRMEWNFGRVNFDKAINFENG